MPDPIVVEEREIELQVQLLSGKVVTVTASTTSSVESVVESVCSLMGEKAAANPDKYSLNYRCPRSVYAVVQLQLDARRALGEYEHHPLYPIPLNSTVLLLGLRSPCPFNCDLLSHGVSVSLDLPIAHTCDPATDVQSNPFILHSPTAVALNTSIAIRTDREEMQEASACLGPNAAALFYEGPCVLVVLEALGVPDQKPHVRAFQSTKVPSGMNTSIALPPVDQPGQRYRLSALSKHGGGFIVEFQTSEE